MDIVCMEEFIKWWLFCFLSSCIIQSIVMYHQKIIFKYCHKECCQVLPDFSSPGFHSVGRGRPWPWRRRSHPRPCWSYHHYRTCKLQYSIYSIRFWRISKNFWKSPGRDFMGFIKQLLYWTITGWVWDAFLGFGWFCESWRHWQERGSWCWCSS